MIHNEATRRESRGKGRGVRGKGLVGSRQRPVRPRFLAVKASMRFLVVFAVCRALGDQSEHAFCPLHTSIARLRGRPPFRPFPPQKRAGRRCRCLKACCGIKLGLGWFRHTKGMLLYFKSHTLRVRLRGRHTQRPALKPCISACVSVQQQRLFNLDASEKLV